MQGSAAHDQFGLLMLANPHSPIPHPSLAHSVAIDQLCVHECYIIGKGGQFWPQPTFKVGRRQPGGALSAERQVAGWLPGLAQLQVQPGSCRAGLPAKWACTNPSLHIFSGGTTSPQCSAPMGRWWRWTGLTSRSLPKAAPAAGRG